MASITNAAAAAAAAGITCISLRPKQFLAGASSTPAISGLPKIGVRKGSVRCSSEEKPAPSGRVVGVRVAAGAASVVGAAGPALALVDERLSTEGTGLSLGISNNLLTWILVGVFAIIWSLFFVYTSTLEEDEESGLSL